MTKNNFFDIEEIKNCLESAIYNTAINQLKQSEKISKKTLDIKFSKQRTENGFSIKLSVTPIEGYEFDSTIKSPKGTSFVDAVDNMIIPIRYVFLATGESNCCSACSQIDYKVSQKIWTDAEITEFMDGQSFTYQGDKGTNYTYNWSNSFKKIKIPTLDSFYFTGSNKDNLLHPNCSCKWIPLKLYKSGMWEKIPWE